MHHTFGMKTWLGLVILAGAAGCYSEYTSPAAPVSYGWNTQQPTTTQGPPGGGMDPGWGDDSNAYAGGDPNEGYAGAPAENAGAPANPADPMGAVNDTEINATL